MSTKLISETPLSEWRFQARWFHDWRNSPVAVIPTRWCDWFIRVTVLIGIAMAIPDLRAHGLDLPRPEEGEIAKIQPPVPGADVFARALLQHMRNRLDARQTDLTMPLMPVLPSPFNPMRRLAGRTGRAQHRDMEIMTHSMRSVCRSGFVAVACAIGVFAGGLPGCRQEEASKARDPAITGMAPAPTEPMSSVENRVAMDTLEPGKWVPIDGAGDVEWDDESRVMRIGVGTDLNGMRWSGALPAMPYVVELEARRMTGSDFFCGLTFPVRSGKDSVSLIVGGWGGSLVGISSIDGLDASENSTGSQYKFEDQRWYRIRVEVGEERLQAWIDDRQVVDAHTEGQKLSMRVGPIEDCAPFGLATWLTSAEVRGVRWRKLGD